LTIELSVSRTRIKTSKIMPEVQGEYSVHDRQEIISGWNQGKISTGRVGCVGAGSLGGKFSQNCARMGMGTIITCDGDIVELSNLNRQFFYPEQKFQNKALALAENLKRECTGETLIDAYPMYFQEVLAEYPRAFENLDVIGCFVDDEEARYQVSKFGRDHKIPVIFSTVSRTTRYGEVIVQDNQGPCLACIKPRTTNDNTQDNQCRDPTVIYIHTAVMGIAVYAAVSLLLGWKLDWNFYGLSLNSDSIVAKCLKKNDCAMCKEAK
jgi:molybdopterin/thiamine biosynthesis adenylyltransferase